MRIVRISIFLLSILAGISLQAQQDFQVGSSNVSIEPDSSVFSLALAGYGAPRDGRFSITWENIGNAPQGVHAITGLGKKLYAVTGEHILVVKDMATGEGDWSTIGRAEGVVALTGFDNILIAVNASGELLSRDLSKKKEGWKKMGSAQRVTAVAVADGRLYASDQNNALLVKKIRSGNWEKIGTAGSSISMMGNGKRVYNIDADDNLFILKSYMPSKGWTKIGRNNNSTFDIKIGRIAIANNRLYALSEDNHIYVARHSTTGDLSARALAVKRGEKTVVIVGFDVCGFDYSLATEIKNVVSKKRKIPPEAIFLNCSHTHFAPVTQTFPAFGEHGQTPDSIYLNGIVKGGIVRAIESALDSMQPASLSFGRGVTRIGHNRSSPDNATPYDSTVDVIYAKGKNKAGSSILFLTSCHPVFRNEGKEGFTISANYPGVTRKLIEDHDSIRHAIFLQACAGDINPREADHRKTGVDLARDVEEVIGKGMEKISGDISFALDTINVPIKTFSKEKVEQFKLENSNKEGDVGAEKNVRWANLMLTYYQQGTLPTTIPVYVQTLNIGNWKLVGLSREVVTAYSFAIKQLWPDQKVSVVGYTNDLPSYLPAESHIRRATYEGYDSFFWNAQPGLFPENVLDIVVDGIKTKNK